MAQQDDDSLNDINFDLDKADDEKRIDDNEEAAGTASEASTTAKCEGDTFEYKPGKPIVSITFSLSSEQPFEVNVGTGITNYKRSEKKAFPVLCEVRDLTGGSDDVKITSLKNKACIAKNLPNVLGPVLTQLNALLLDQYTAYYEKTKYDDFVAAQDDFKNLEIKEGDNSESNVKPDKEEGEKMIVKGDVAVISDEVIKRREGIDKLIEQLKGKSTGQIISADDEKLLDITTKNGVDLPTLKLFLEKHKSEVFPLRLLPLTYGSQQIFMTNNGVVTNGKQIFSYNNITETTIESSGLFESKLNSEKYEEAKNRYNGSNTIGFYLEDSVIKDGFTKKGGKRKTLSQKLFKKRITRRNRK
jgi:hypothetical protein